MRSPRTAWLAPVSDRPRGQQARTGPCFLDVQIAGRFADFPADVELRKLAAGEVDVLVRKEGIPGLEAQLRVA